jgi:hypothetical protein
MKKISKSVTKPVTKPTTEPTYAELKACLIGLSPGYAAHHAATRDRLWAALNDDLPGLRPPAPHSVAGSLTTFEFFSRDQVYQLLERAVAGRDRTWRTWCLDLLSQVQEPNGPPPIHLHFNGIKL